jgi:hypothetical protein
MNPAALIQQPLARGGHAASQQQACVMELAAYLANEPWSDAPACVSPVIAAFLVSWNDALPDADRERLLKPLAWQVLGTKTTDADEETRAWMATDWLVRVQTPAWLRLAGLMEHAQALEALARISDATLARAAQPTVEAARHASAAASAAAWDAWAAAWDASAAAWGASAAAWDAWAAAWGASAAAWDARAAAWDASAAAWDASAAAWDASAAAWDRLAPTVAALQASALDLVHAMIAVGKVDVTPRVPMPGASITGGGAA